MATPQPLSIVVPAYNEQTRLPSSIRKIFEFDLENPGRIAEVIVVDDGSRDLTRSVVRSLMPDHPRLRLVSYLDNAGKGYAIRRGVTEVSRGELVLITDADLSTPLSQLAFLEGAIDEGYDIAIGSRAIDVEKVRVRQPWYRQSMGKGFNLVLRRLTGIPFRDTQCGFKLLRRDAAKEIFRQATIDRFAYDVEMILLAGRLGYSVAEVAVEWINSPDSRVRILRDSPRMLADVIRTRIRVGPFRANANSATRAPRPASD
ncbi:MAG: dolichyl-phosphate beta-glucosyltransferase [Thermoanaerobaculia bacterium]